MIVVAAIALGCGDDGPTTTDSTVPDADTPDASMTTVAPAAPPVLTPCPPGWREVMVPDIPGAVCDPWPDGDPATCPDGEAHFPGEDGCATVGPPCPAGRFPEGLPADRTIRYVDGSVAPGGDGSMASPYDTLTDALRDSGAGDVVAVAKGTYDEDLFVRGGITIWGACATETRLTSSRPATLEPIIDVQRADVEVRGVSIGGARPAAIVTTPEGSLTLDGVIVEESALLGVGVSAGALTAREVVFSDVSADASGNFGSCVLAQGGATAELSRVVVQRCVSAGLTIDDVGTIVRMEDSVVRDVLPHRSGALGRGLSFQTGSRGELSRVVIEGVRELGVISSGDGTAVDVSDSYVRDTLPEEDGSYGRGLTAQRGGALTVRRSRISGTREAALVFSEGGEIVLEDLVVHDTLAQEIDDLYGFAVASHESPVEARRVAVATSRYVGVNLDGAGVVAAFEDLSILSTRSSLADGRFGRGLNVQGGADLSVTRARVVANRDVGVAAFEATARFVDLIVEGTEARECAETTCTDFPAGVGIGVYRGADVDVESFVVDGSALVGVQVAEAGELDLVRGVISDNPIGANVQIPGYDLDRLSEEVAYRDNGTNLDAMDLPVPSAADPIRE
jgi:hypothetical protein